EGRGVLLPQRLLSPEARPLHRDRARVDLSDADLPVVAERAEGRASAAAGSGPGARAPASRARPADRHRGHRAVRGADGARNRAARLELPGFLHFFSQRFTSAATQKPSSSARSWPAVGCTTRGAFHFRASAREQSGSTRPSAALARTSIGTSGGRAGAR